MRIGFDLRTLAEGKTTGVEIYAINLLKNLLEIDKKNSYELFFNSRKSAPQNIFPTLPANASITFLRYPNRTLNVSFKLLNYPKIDRLLGGIDVFFSPRYLFTALSKSCKLIVTAHDLSFIHFPEFFSFKQKIWHRFLSDKSACKKSDAIIAVSNATKNDLVNIFGLAPQKIKVIHPGIDHLTYHAGTNPEEAVLLREKTGVGGEYILSLGTIEPRKNILSIIDAFEKLQNQKKSDIKLVITGKLGWLYLDVVKKIRDSPYKDKIIALESIDEELKPILYRHSKLFVFPSFLEGFGFPPLEAMASGVPVIASYNSSFPEVLCNACVYVNPYNARSLTSAMDEILTDSALASRFITQGLERSKLFSWKKTAQQTLDLINSLAST